MEANPLVEEALGQVAVKYGPIVYCLESNDLPAGVKLTDVALGLEEKYRKFAAERMTIAGEEVVALRGTGLEIQRESGGLYREASAKGAREIAIRLVPYFAWDNRGDTEMTVWLPGR
jgi:DUF1680 family protein